MITLFRFIIKMTLSSFDNRYGTEDVCNNVTFRFYYRVVRMDWLCSYFYIIINRDLIENRYDKLLLLKYD